MRVDVPAQRVSSMMAAKDRSRDAIVMIEPIDRITQPAGIDRMRIGIKQHNPFIPGTTHAGFGSLAVIVTQLPLPPR